MEQQGYYTYMNTHARVGATQWYYTYMNTHARVGATMILYIYEYSR